MPLHVAIQEMLTAAKKAGRPSLSSGSPAQARAMVAGMRQALGRGPEGIEVERLNITGRHHSIPARLYWPSAQPLGMVVYVHGGGWVCGALDDFDALARFLAQRSCCALLLVDYRLAPEFPFPAGLQDVEDALIWADEHGANLIGKKVPLIVAGDSAGANLGIAAVLSTRKRISVTLQSWFYPVTDCDMTRPSYQAFSAGLPLTEADMRWFFQHYAPPDRWSSPEIAVLRSSSLGLSPRTWIATAEYDVLRDEGEVYAAKLRALGVDVELHRVAGMPHGFARMFDLVDTAREAVAMAAAVMAACAISERAGN